MRKIRLLLAVLFVAVAAACAPEYPSNGPATAVQRLEVSTLLLEFEGKGVALVLNDSVQDHAVLSRSRPAVLRAPNALGPGYELWVEAPDPHEFPRFTFQNLALPVRHDGTVQIRVAELTSCYRLTLFIFMDEERQAKVKAQSLESVC